MTKIEARNTCGAGADTILERLGLTPADLTARGLRIYPEAESLEVVETGDDGREHLLIPEAAGAWRGLKQAALDDGIPLFIVSAFRSVGRQEEIVRRKLDAGLAVADILSVSAPPGYSEHHTGCAVDVSTPGSPLLEESFEETPAFRWLASQAGRFGFHLSYPRGNACGYDYEPWHWCFRAPE
ncbi:D-alanyl-D-alanine carboxypeptidase family protein [Methylococcus sp. EFPC2]|uniref:M15 family metallopeptidase n=1 Tax=Methylococcus sp. EFPC2 TaxID=2812648 RepID=UPI001966F723|nr:M15 family metallopeptidase [Methylococcus sp. EFPC2]QSA96116.1 D-alanyl-D-alanine carboxypeptidase family protein [Methylococcus sp. EFPC2]